MVTAEKRATPFLRPNCVMPHPPVLCVQQYQTLKMFFSANIQHFHEKFYNRPDDRVLN